MTGILLGYGTSNKLKKYGKKLGVDMRSEFIGSIIAQIRDQHNN